MSVNYNLLPVTGSQLTQILSDPESLPVFVKQHENEICSVSTNIQAILFTVASDTDDPLLFLESGGPAELAGWVGEYTAIDGGDVKCEVDMGYGPASYFRTELVARMSGRLQQWTVEKFASACDVDELESACVYPSGWQEPGRREDLIEFFAGFRDCIMSAAESGKHLLAWSA